MSLGCMEEGLARAHVPVVRAHHAAAVRQRHAQRVHVHGAAAAVHHRADARADLLLAPLGGLARLPAMPREDAWRGVMGGFQTERSHAAHSPAGLPRRIASAALRACAPRPSLVRAAAPRPFQSPGRGGEGTSAWKVRWMGVGGGAYCKCAPGCAGGTERGAIRAR